ncbi:hypothetical protein BD310DRAFT_1006898, partial [Dichomitus squalens]
MFLGTEDHRSSHLVLAQQVHDRALFGLGPCNSIEHIQQGTCAISTRGSNAIQYLTYIVPAAFTAIRVYALRRSLTLCAITAGLSLAPLGINFASFRLGLTGENIFPIGCTPLVNVSTVTIISRSCLIAADCLAIGVTWFTLGLQYPAHRGGMLKGSISRVLIMDGAILAVLNSLHLAFTLLSISVAPLQSASVLTEFTTPLSAILVSRFLLHLQSASLRAVGSIPSSQISSLHLNRSLVLERVVGSLGASITAEDYLKEDHGDDDN